MRVTDTRLAQFWHNRDFMALAERIQRRLVWEYKKRTFKPYVITKKLEGEEIKIIVSDLFAKGWYELRDQWPELVWIKENLLNKGDIVADCGANIGFTSLFFANCVGYAGNVIGFEALRANAIVARKNIKLNKVTNCEIVNSAVGAIKGHIKFDPYPNGSVAKTESSRNVDVPVITLDEFYEDKKNPTFIKIDVEGYEIEVLKGAQEIFKTRPNFVIEIHCCFFSDPINIINKIFELIPLQDYETHIQLVVDREIVPFEPSLHTAEVTAAHDVVHLFGKSLC